MITIRERELPQAVRTMVEEVAISKEISTSDVVAQLLIWTVDKVQEAKSTIHKALDDDEIEACRKLVKNTPINGTFPTHKTPRKTAEKIMTLLNDFGKLYIIMTATRPPMKWLTASQYAARMKPRCSRQYVCQLIKRGVLQARKAKIKGKEIWQIPIGEKEK